MTEPQWINVGTMDDLAEIWPRLVRLTGTPGEMRKVLRPVGNGTYEMRRDIYELRKGSRSSTHFGVAVPSE